MFIADQWKDYELLDTSDGERLERWGRFILVRPDPQIIWHGVAAHPLWKKADAVYRRSSSGGGAWQQNKLPAEWEIGYRDLRFVIRPMGFKHTGLFPEPAANWDWFAEKIKKAGLYDFFDAVLISEAEQCSKPNPFIFAHALERLACTAEEAVFVGDSPTADVCGARGAGASSCAAARIMAPRSGSSAGADRGCGWG